MKALSIRQPWAWAIVHCGKDVENRTWYTGYRGEVLIHACALPPRTNAGRIPRALQDELVDALDAIEQLVTLVGPLSYDMLRAQSGGIVARARIVDCVRESKSPWFVGPWGIVLADVTPIDIIPCRGQLGLWDCHGLSRA